MKLAPIGIVVLLLAGLAVLVGVISRASGGDTPSRDEGSSARKAADQPVEIMAIDASKSALEFHLDWVSRIARESDELPLSTTQELYRFDTNVHELYSGQPISRMELKELLAVINRDRQFVGTSMLQLAHRLDERRVAYPGRPLTFWIFTDCGVEEMTPSDHAELRAITGRWAEDPMVKAVHLIGVRPLHREALRNGFGPLGDRLQME